MCIFRNRCIHGDIIMRRVIYNHYKNKAIHIIEFKKFLSLEEFKIKIYGRIFINVNDVIQCGCTLKTITSNTRLDLSKPIPIKKIRTFYVENYYLITRNSVNGNNKHFINSYLSKIRIINPGRGRFRGLYSLPNYYMCVQSFGHGYVPKDLFHPIKFYFNGVFWGDQYRISDFLVDTELKISY